MNCSTETRKVSAYMDRKLTREEHEKFAAHLNECSNCALHYRQQERVRQSLRGLPQRVPPGHLTANLRVIAARERGRRLECRNLRTRYSSFRDSLDLLLANVMRPLALPLAGGLFSTIVLFSIFVPSFAVRGDADTDIPTGLTTEPTVKTMAPLGISDNDVVVDLTIDRDGRMKEYTVVGGKHLLHNDDLRRSIENNLLFTVFEPATAFGQPMSGKIRLSFRSRRIEVKG